MLKSIRNTPLGVALVASLVATALITSVLAFVTDTVQILGNNVTSEDYIDVQQSEAHNLEIGPVSNPTSCDTVTYRTDDVITISDDPFGSNSPTVDLTGMIDNGTYFSKITSRYCIRNASGNEITGVLRATLLTRSSTEVGNCNTAESNAETTLGATGCADGEAGELDQVLQINIKDGAVRCSQNPANPQGGVTFSPGDAVGTSKLITDADGTVVFADGSECLINITVTPASGITQDQFISAVTDIVAFDIALELIDEITP